MRWQAAAVAAVGLALGGCAHQEKYSENQPEGGFTAEPTATAEAGQSFQTVQTTSQLPAARPGYVWRCGPCCGSQTTAQMGGAIGSESVDLGARQNVAGKTCIKPCPEKQPVAGRVSACTTARVNFAFDSSDLDDAAKKTLHDSADCLKQNRQVRVIIAGHTDPRGTAQYNFGLGQERAGAVAEFLHQEGVSNDQMLMLSFGKDRPLCKGDNEDCWKRDRRATVHPMSNTAAIPRQRQ
jgi:peptidoglycan-associated lipoprotein